MADSKITALTELTDPAVADLLPAVDDVAGTATTKKVTLQNISDLIAVTEPNNASSMARQAIINGNFDVWQRGTSFSISGANPAVFGADRWRDTGVQDGGTFPTLTRTREMLTSGDIANAFYYTRLATNGAGSSLGVNSFYLYDQKIENGTRNLCGNGKTVTVSFYARSDIANKKLGFTVVQNYGSGGSPSTIEYIQNAPITLTSTWTKYTATFTTNTLSGKTFGTDNNDYLGLRFWLEWGATLGGTQLYTGVSAETFVGAGNIDIAQVQLCAGDVALPFMPKSYEEELRACQRYYETGVWEARRQNNDTLRVTRERIGFQRTKRIIPTITVSNAGSINLTTCTKDDSYIYLDNFSIAWQASSATDFENTATWTASAEL